MSEELNNPIPPVGSASDKPATPDQSDVLAKLQQSISQIENLSSQVEALKQKNAEIAEEKRKVREQKDKETNAKLSLEEQIKLLQEENSSRKKAEIRAKKEATITRLISGKVLSETIANEFFLNRAQVDDEGDVQFNFNGSMVSASDALNKFFDIAPEMKPSEQRSGAGSKPSNASIGGLEAELDKAKKNKDVHAQIRIKRQMAGFQ